MKRYVINLFACAVILAGATMTYSAASTDIGSTITSMSKPSLPSMSICAVKGMPPCVCIGSQCIVTAHHLCKCVDRKD